MEGMEEMVALPLDGEIRRVWYECGVRKQSTVPHFSPVSTVPYHLPMAPLPESPYLISALPTFVSLFPFYFPIGCALLYHALLYLPTTHHSFPMPRTMMLDVPLLC